MSKFESKVKPIAYPQSSVYKMLSDLKNLERVKERMPEDKLNDFVVRQRNNNHKCTYDRAYFDACSGA